MRPLRAAMLVYQGIMANNVAFLRGMNVGGHKSIKMSELARLFESLRLSNVKTVLASGNVLFESPETDAAILTRSIERGLRGALGYEVKVILRTTSQLQALVSLDPFEKVGSAPGVRLHITFLAADANSTLPLPYVSPNGFEIIEKSAREVLSVVRPEGCTVDLMTFVEKEFGKASTTRTWNTVQKIAAL